MQFTNTFKPLSPLHNTIPSGGQMETTHLAQGGVCVCMCVFSFTQSFGWLPKQQVVASCILPSLLQDALRLSFTSYFSWFVTQTGVSIPRAESAPSPSARVGLSSRAPTPCGGHGEPPAVVTTGRPVWEDRPSLLGTQSQQRAESSAVGAGVGVYAGGQWIPASPLGRSPSDASLRRPAWSLDISRGFPGKEPGIRTSAPRGALGREGRVAASPGRRFRSEF